MSTKSSGEGVKSMMSIQQKYEIIKGIRVMTSD